jgi:hypothetical protein
MQKKNFGIMNKVKTAANERNRRATSHFRLTLPISLKNRLQISGSDGMLL